MLDRIVGAHTRDEYRCNDESHSENRGSDARHLFTSSLNDPTTDRSIGSTIYSSKSIRRTFPSFASATHNVSSATAIVATPVPVANRARVSPLTGSSRSTSPVDELWTQSIPSAAVSQSGPTTSTRATTSLDVGSILNRAPRFRSADPDGFAGDRHCQWRPNRYRCDDGICGGINPGNGVVGETCDPNCRISRSDHPAWVVDCDRCEQCSSLGVNSNDGVMVLGRHP